MHSIGVANLAMQAKCGNLAITDIELQHTTTHIDQYHFPRPIMAKTGEVWLVNIYNFCEEIIPLESILGQLQREILKKLVFFRHF